MPELPFLTVLAEHLAAKVQGRTVEDVLVRSASVLKSFDPPITALRGAQVTGIRRRGKFLLFDLRPPLVLVMHLMRNGRVQLTPRSVEHAAGSRRILLRPASRDLALVIALEGGTDLRMIEMGPEKAASVWLFHAGDELAGPLARLGVEPLSGECTSEALARMLRGERMRLKPFLLAQRYLAGIGNAYADEILWEARLSPQALTTALTDEEAARLREAVVTTLGRAVEAHRAGLAGALPMKEPLGFLWVHRHGKEPCPRCGTPIAVIYYEDRETYYCPECQTGGRVYADRRRSRLLR